ncbi:hypothetical protein SCATT_03250 [Streptantibioticus cattleyicolor NRRL 8057 = DSM 46488]|uniref:Uncharacterized protein n=1 Tax=Streptantibioticus cattleyicolor (strain ATCC 35852 / DSM 46488 / JCM 4925 / NBRC 14057 / NRRL 8057) TaxID=1003195 RepID=G8WMX7_STREN|nr:hypothetical protein SCATT_03250 [Streptantibioticus cattleyicolor NRRL 8057 = DSM 46488]
MRPAATRNEAAFVRPRFMVGPVPDRLKTPGSAGTRHGQNMT